MSELDIPAAVAALSDSGSLRPAEIASLIEEALVTAYRRAVGADAILTSSIDLETGEFRLIRTDDDGESSEVAIEGDLARQAAQAVRSGVARALREVAKDEVLREAEMRRGQLLDGVVERNQGAVMLLRIGDHLALLPPEEQLKGETPALRQHLKVVVIDARRRAQDAVLVVSRSHPLLLHLLMEQEVPEIQTGQVVIRGIVRDPGVRSKVAVQSADPAIDARGACIGAKGVRHRAVTTELGSEQVQIVTWSEDTAEYIASAVAPAIAHGVVLDEATHTARVTVAEDQLSLAIGRRGENARLVARLTGWRIDIVAGPAADG